MAAKWGGGDPGCGPGYAWSEAIAGEVLDR